MLASLLDGRVLAERHGDAPFNVLALHGWSRTRQDWNQVLRGTNAIAVDLPGHGVAPPPDTAWGSPEYAALMLEMLDDELLTNPRPITLVGHSFGGRIAIHMAAMRPELFERVVLTGAPLIRQPSTGRAKAPFRIARKLHSFGLISDSRMNHYRNKYGSADYRATAGVMREIFVKLVNEDYDAQIAAVAESGLPVHLVWGANDTAAPLSSNRALLERIPGAELTVLADSAHLLDPALNEALRQKISEEPLT